MLTTILEFHLHAQTRITGSLIYVDYIISKQFNFRTIIYQLLLTYRIYLVKVMEREMGFAATV